VKQAIFAVVNHARIHAWNQPALSNEGKVWGQWQLKVPNPLFRWNTLPVYMHLHC